MSSIAPRIPVNGTYNFRDIGGYPAEGGLTRSRKLFRSDGLHSLGETGKAALRDLGVRFVIDLRNDFETTVMPDDLSGLDVQVLRMPVFEGSGASQSTAGTTLDGLYEKIVLQHRDVVVGALREIAGTGEDAVVVHCTAGKDRTGIVVALALLAVGVDRDTVIGDYASTQQNLAGPWLDRMLALASSHGVEVTPDLRIIMGGSPPEALERALGLIDREAGNVHRYLRDSGMDDLELVRLRSVLVRGE